MGAIRISGTVGFYSFGTIQDGTTTPCWSFPPGITGGGTTPSTLIMPTFNIQVCLAPSAGLSFKKPADYSGPMRQNNATLMSQIVSYDTGRLTKELLAFETHYVANASRYQDVAVKVSMPVALVAALHWREASGNFNRMLSNGAALDKKSTIVPYDGPYDSWEDSAVAALTSKARSASIVELDKFPNDLVVLATFAELWNGRGYYNRGLPSPYVFSGTNVYTAGKFVADGKFDSAVVDAQIGVVPMLVKLRGIPQAL